jgi:DNA (cytosine-5)-methyltransferase 1
VPQTRQDWRRQVIKAVDFFCGAGGLTRGLKRAGVDVILGVDGNDQFRDTYVRNNPPTRFLCRNIRTLSAEELEGELGDRAGVPLLFAACAPCQPFSQQRTSHRDVRQRTLLGEMLRFVEHFTPDYLLFENVPGIARVKGNSTYNRVVAVLTELGYSHDAGTLDAKAYGVPQTRRRHILLGSRIGEVLLPKPTHGTGLKPYTTVRQAISKYPPIKAGEIYTHVPNHRASSLTRINLQRIGATAHDGGDRRDWPAGITLECHRKGYDGHTDVYGRMRWDRPAPTLTCRCHSLSNGRYGHPVQDRAMSLREAAALQTFPNRYVFYGTSKASIGEQIGNAVPVRLAAALGRAIMRSHAKSKSMPLAATSS